MCSDDGYFVLALQRGENSHLERKLRKWSWSVQKSQVTLRITAVPSKMKNSAPACCKCVAKELWSEDCCALSSQEPKETKSTVPQWLQLFSE